MPVGTPLSETLLLMVCRSHLFLLAALPSAPAAGFAAPLTRRAVLVSAGTGSTLAARRSAVAMAAANHAVAEAVVDGIRVPVALWYPPGASLPPGARSSSSYTYVIDIGGIARGFKLGWLGWLPRRENKLPAPAAVDEPPVQSSTARQGDAVMFTHGFLGSPLDMAHVCEALAARGFTVVAPEFPESLSASYANPVGIGRDEIVAATREYVDAGRGVRWGISLVSNALHPGLATSWCPPPHPGAVLEPPTHYPRPTAHMYHNPQYRPPRGLRATGVARRSLLRLRPPKVEAFATVEHQASSATLRGRGRACSSWARTCWAALPSAPASEGMTETTLCS